MKHDSVITCSTITHINVYLHPLIQTHLQTLHQWAYHLGLGYSLHFLFGQHILP